MANVQIAYEYAEIDLEGGEVICPECKGHSYHNCFRYCPKCFGAGKLDWIEMIIGKDEPQVSSSKSSMTSSSTTKKRRI